MDTRGCKSVGGDILMEICRSSKWSAGVQEHNYNIRKKDTYGLELLSTKV